MRNQVTDQVLEHSCSGDDPTPSDADVAPRHTGTPVSMQSINPRHRRAASAIARGLRQSPVRRSTSLVELKPGGSRPLFFIHDGDGQTLLYLNLAHRLPPASDLSIVGIEPLRLQGVPLAHPSVEAMAAYYVTEIRRHQPSGPYLVAGLCAGGVIAFEIACQLQRAGESIDRLFILDSAVPGTPRRQGVARQRVGRLMQALAGDGSADRSRVARAWTACAVIARKAANTVGWEITNRAARWSIAARFRLLRFLRARELPWPRFLPELTVRQIYESADARYDAGRLCDTTVVLVRALAGAGDDQPYREIYADDTLGWAAHTDRLTTIDADGGHSSMLQEPWVQPLAAAMAAAMPPVRSAG